MERAGALIPAQFRSPGRRGRCTAVEKGGSLTPPGRPRWGRGRRSCQTGHKPLHRYNVRPHPRARMLAMCEIRPVTPALWLRAWSAIVGDPDGSQHSRIKPQIATPPPFARANDRFSPRVTAVTTTPTKAGLPLSASPEIDSARRAGWRVTDTSPKPAAITASAPPYAIRATSEVCRCT